jgi:hypothetical protein
MFDWGWDWKKWWLTRVDGSWVVFAPDESEPRAVVTNFPEALKALQDEMWLQNALERWGITY